MCILTCRWWLKPTKTYDSKQWQATTNRPVDRWAWYKSGSLGILSVSRRPNVSQKDAQFCCRYYSFKSFNSHNHPTNVIAGFARFACGVEHHPLSGLHLWCKPSRRGQDSYWGGTGEGLGNQPLAQLAREEPDCCCRKISVSINHLLLYSRGRVLNSWSKHT